MSIQGMVLTLRLFHFNDTVWWLVLPSPEGVFDHRVRFGVCFFVVFRCSTGYDSAGGQTGTDSSDWGIR